MTGFLLKKGNLEIRHAHKETPCENKGWDLGDTSLNQGRARRAANHQKVGERLGTDSFSPPSEGPNTADTLT